MCSSPCCNKLGGTPPPPSLHSLTQGSVQGIRWSHVALSVRKEIQQCHTSQVKITINRLYIHSIWYSNLIFACIPHLDSNRSRIWRLRCSKSKHHISPVSAQTQCGKEGEGTHTAIFTTTENLISDVTLVTLFRNVPSKNAYSCLNVYSKCISTKVAKQRWQTTIEGHGYVSFNVLKTTVQPKPVWSGRKRKAPLAARILFLLPTEILRAPSAQYWAPMDPSHVWGLMYEREGQISECRWQSNKYTMKFGLYSFAVRIPSLAVGCWRTPTILCTLQHGIVLLWTLGGNPFAGAWGKSGQSSAWVLYGNITT